MSLIFAAIMAFSFTVGGVVEDLKKGNQAFAGNTQFTNEQRQQLAQGQKPMATVLACSDSRVPPEMIFNKNLGDLFVVRIAGNTIDQLSLASLEYGVSYLETPVLLILGHQNCGAVKAAFDLSEQNYDANIGALLAQISPAILEAKKRHPNQPKSTQIERAIELNLNHTESEILYRSQVIRNLVKDQKLSIQKAVFQIDTGKVVWQ